MDLKDPVVVYTAASNLEAHVIVDMLTNNGISAHAVEDQSAVSLWQLGTISQFHKPKVWVDRSRAKDAAELIAEFEDKRNDRRQPATSDETISSQCEECMQASDFPAAQNGTTQDCPHCGAFMDVGDLKWDDADFGVAEDE